MKRGLPESSEGSCSKFVSREIESESDETNILRMNRLEPAVETNIAENILSSEVVAGTSNLSSEVDAVRSYAPSEESNVRGYGQPGQSVASNYVPPTVNRAGNFIPPEVTLAAAYGEFSEERTNSNYFAGALIRSLLVKKCNLKSLILSFCSKYNITLLQKDEYLHASIYLIVNDLIKPIKDIFNAVKDIIKSSEHIGFFVKSVSRSLLGENHTRRTIMLESVELFILFLTITCQIATLNALKDFFPTMEPFVAEIGGEVLLYRRGINDSEMQTVYNYDRHIAGLPEKDRTAKMRHFRTEVRKCSREVVSEMFSRNK